MNVSIDNVSEMQERLLTVAKASDNPRELISIIERIVTDDDLLEGRESVHPEWYSILSSILEKPDSLASSRLKQRLYNFFEKMNPVDLELQKINPNNNTFAKMKGSR